MPKLKWYLIDSERTFYKLWDFMITWLIIYTLFVTPFLLVFRCLLSCYLCNEPDTATGKVSMGDFDCEESDANWTIRKIEFSIDVVWLINIIVNFFIRTRT